MPTSKEKPLADFVEILTTLRMGDMPSAQAWHGFEAFLDWLTTLPQDKFDKAIFAVLFDFASVQTSLTESALLCAMDKNKVRKYFDNAESRIRDILNAP